MTEEAGGQLETEAVFEMIADPECRALLAATADSARTVPELSDSCDIPTSTVYRKINALANTELVEEHIRIRLSGNHVREYRLQVEAVRVDLTGTDAQALRCVAHTHPGLQSMRDSDTEEVQTGYH